MAKPVLYGNVLFVDALFGDNKTAKPYNPAYPYLTVSAAIKAASKLNRDTTVQVKVGTGIFYDSPIKLIKNISVVGSGRLDTQIYAQFDTSELKNGESATVLELTNNTFNLPAVIGTGAGDISFRRSRHVSTFTDSSSNQSACTISNGHHVFSDADCEVMSLGSSKTSVFRQTGGNLEIERTNNTVTGTAYSVITVDPSTNPVNTPYVLPTDNTQYIFTGAYTIVLPNQGQGSFAVPSFHSVILTQQSGGPSIITSKAEFAGLKKLENKKSVSVSIQKGNGINEPPYYLSTLVRGPQLGTIGTANIYSLEISDPPPIIPITTIPAGTSTTLLTGGTYQLSGGSGTLKIGPGVKGEHTIFYISNPKCGKDYTIKGLDDVEFVVEGKRVSKYHLSSNGIIQMTSGKKKNHLYKVISVSSLPSSTSVFKQSGFPSHEQHQQY